MSKKKTLSEEKPSPQRVAFLVLGPKKPYDKRREEIATRARKAFQGADWTVRTVRPRALASNSATGSRPTQVLEPWDAHQMYIEAHRSQVAVVQIMAVEVLKNPENWPRPRNLITLEQFLRYKACLIHASPEDAEVDFVAAAKAWLDESTCTSQDDPRCMPLHVFSPDTDWDALAEGTATFESAHGKAGKRKDFQSRAWPKDHAAHANKVDTVAGMDLQQGFHWDIQALPNESAVHNALEVWTLAEDGHLNVYPDSHLREGTLSKIKFRAERPSTVLDTADAGPAGKPKAGRHGSKKPLKASRRRSRGR